MALNDAWYYLEENTGARQYGWMKLGNTWYYLERETGKMYKDGIHTIDGKEYYFYNWGGMASGWWYLDENTGDWYYFRGDGSMAKSAWIEWKDAYYYVGANGVMFTDTVTPDGHQVNKMGQWIR